MEVSEHGIRFPSSEETNGIAVDVGTQQPSGAAGSEGPGFDLVRRDVESVGANIDDTIVKGVSNVLGENMKGATVPGEVGTQRGIGRAIALAQVNKTAYHSANGAHVNVATSSMGDDFPLNTILLGGEHEGDSNFQ